MPVLQNSRKQGTMANYGGMEWCSIWCFCLLALIAMSSHMVLSGPPESIGVCYGMKGNNLPPPDRALALLQECGISRVRLYEPNQAVMEAGFDGLISIAARNEDLPKLAANLDAATVWLSQNYILHEDNIVDIVLGNDAVMGDYAQYLVPAIRNVRTVLDRTASPDVMVTTAISSAALADTFPPSRSIFKDNAVGIMRDLVDLFNNLPSGRQPFLYISVYPYFTYANHRRWIPLNYTLFLSKTPRSRQREYLAYYNLFDEIYDGYVWALEKVGGKNIGLVVETGWPWFGNHNLTTMELASTYITNLYNHIVNKNQSPKRPGAVATVFVHSLFNENLTPSWEDQSWGLFFPNMQKVYSTPLCG